MKILTILGARPQFIKAAAVSRLLMQKGITEVIVHTGQHFDHNMSQVFFNEMSIPTPHYNLNIHNLPHGAMTGRMMEEVEKVIFKETPNLVMVYGDTNSTLAGALAAKKLNVEVAHVEAGLRSYNLAMPEEVNRILTDRISTHLFCPTQNAINNLNLEGFERFGCNVLYTGDVMLDAALFYGAQSATRSNIIERLKLHGGYSLATVHRQENTDNKERLRKIVTDLNAINAKQRVVVPLHPRSRKALEELNFGFNFLVIDPVGYFDMVELIKGSSIVLTDSGGLQKEAYFFGKPCVTLRNETEWVELVEHGINVLADCDKIFQSWDAMFGKKFNFELNLYGGGRAAEVISNYILGL